MPRKPKRPCSFPGCPNLTDGRYCEKHQKIIAKRYEKYERSPATKKRYGKSWKKIRDAYVSSHPLCELCLKNGRYVVAEEVHHKKPLAEGGTHDWNNLIALCKACHARIHAKRGDRWHKKVEFKNVKSETKQYTQGEYESLKTRKPRTGEGSRTKKTHIQKGY